MVESNDKKYKSLTGSGEGDLSSFEGLKKDSNYLRGTIKEGLDDHLTGSISPNDQLLIKFHGLYQQQNRDLDEERKRQKLEPLFSFLIRIRVPAGVVTPSQWISIDQLADSYGDGTLKLTTRQAFQLHGVLKRNLRTTIQKINSSLMDTIAACGDVNRNVMSSANPYESKIHAQVAEDAVRFSAHFTPQTKAYHEIWLDGEMVAGGKKESEPLYGKTYLPRKFKTAFVVPPQNDADILTNDLGFIAIVKKNQVVGYNLTIGGGMAYTFGNRATFPRLADVVGFLPREKMLEVAEGVLLFQRDHGNRSERRNARLKYTMERFDLNFFHKELLRTKGVKLEKAKPFNFNTLGDKLGWIQGDDDLWHFGLFVEGGKLGERSATNAKNALREVAEIHKGSFILTGNQNVVIAQVRGSEKSRIDSILAKHDVISESNISAMRQNSIACAALPYCSLAFAEAERYLPSLIDRIDDILLNHGLFNDPITIRMTGCPNGCGRPFMGEIALVGRGPSKYNLYLGADFTGIRLNKLYKEMLSEDQVIEELEPLLAEYAKARETSEHFGDFLIRKGYVKATTTGVNFHD